MVWALYHGGAINLEIIGAAVLVMTVWFVMDDYKGPRSSPSKQEEEDVGDEGRLLKM